MVHLSLAGHHVIVYTGDKSQANFLYLVAPLNSNQAIFKGNMISTSGSSRKKPTFYQKKHEVFSVVPDTEGVYDMTRQNCL